MEPAPLRDLRDVAWFERSLMAGVGSIHLYEGGVIAGDWDGGIQCWDLEGESRWTAKTSNRVSAMACGGDVLYAVCGRDLTCLSLADGSIHWTKELEGSSDLVACTPDGSVVVATSSIFDLEMNDFLEATLWRFDAEGELLRKDSINERPWSLEMRDDGVASLGLGRPRCGMVRAEADGLHHTPLPTDAPATCGLAGRDRSVIGHADGCLTCIEEGMVLEDAPFAKQPGSIEALACTPQGLLVGVAIEAGPVGAGFGGASGLARAYDSDGHMRWQVETTKGCNVEHLIDGPEVRGADTAWIVTFDGSMANIEVRDEGEGTSLVRFEFGSRLNATASQDNLVAIGFDDGSLFILEGDLLTRRLSENGDSELEARDSSMAARLRALRN
jgi:outer membrane protein assembly factor BamB